MSVHYKFKSALDYDTVTFDGLHISVGDLKAAISQQKRIGKTSDFDLQITNAQTKEVYVDDNTLIPKNTSLLVARVPLAQQPKKHWEGFNNNSASVQKDVAPNKGVADLSRMEGSEQDKINAMISQSTYDYDPSNYQKFRGQNQRGIVPPNYTCYKCKKGGHWIKDCPIALSGESLEIRRSTGIPRSFMVAVDGPQAPGAMITPSGTYAVPAVDRDAYMASENSGEPETVGNAPAAPEPSIPDELICSLCRDLLTDAVMIPCCGNSFCDECIRGALLESEDHECPDCREKEISPTTLIPNRFLRNSVSSFRNQTGYSRRTPHRPSVVPPVQVLPPPAEIPVHLPPPNGPVQPMTTEAEPRVPGSGVGPESESDDDVTVRVPPPHAHRPQNTHRPPPYYGPPQALKPPGMETPPNIPIHMQRPEEQRSSTPTVDERRDPMSQNMYNRGPLPPFMPGVPPPQRFDNRPYRGPPPGRHHHRMETYPRGPYQPPPPGIKDSPTNGQDEDPLEAFNRMIREKEMRAKRREEERRRVHSGSRSPHSRPRSRSRSRSRTPRSRIRSPPPARQRFSRSRSISRGRARVRSPWSPRRRRSRERSLSMPRSQSPPRRHRSPLRYRTPLRSPPRSPPRTPQRSPLRSPLRHSVPRSPLRLSPRSPLRSPPRSPLPSPRRDSLRSPRPTSPHRYTGVYDELLSPRRSDPPYGSRYGPRNNLPPPQYVPLGGKPIPNVIPVKIEPPIGYRGRYDASSFEDVPPGVDPPVPGYEPPHFDKPPFGPPGVVDRDRAPSFRDTFRPPPYVEGSTGYRELPIATVQSEIPVHVGEHPPRYRDNYRPGGPMYRDQGPVPYRDPQIYKDQPQPQPHREGGYRGGPPPSLRDNNFRNHPYRDSVFRENATHNFRDGPPAFRPPSADSREPPPLLTFHENFRDGFNREDPNHLRSSFRPRGRGSSRRNPNLDHERHRDRETRDRERYIENRDPTDRGRDVEKRSGRDAREERSRDFDRNRDHEKERDRDYDRATPEKKPRMSPKRSRETREKKRSESRGQSRDRDRDAKREKKEERIREKSVDRNKDHKEKDKKIKEKKKKKKEKESEKKKKRDKKDKKDKESVKKEDEDMENSDMKSPKDVKDSNVEEAELEKLVPPAESLLVAPIIKKESFVKVEAISKPKDDLYGDEAAEDIDKEIIQNYVKSEDNDANNVTKNNDSVNKDEPFDGLELQAPADELDLKADLESTNEKEMLAPLPVLSKWEVEDDIEKKEPGELSSPDEEEDEGKVTSEVIKRAENAIFAKAISSLRPIEIKKISSDRLKLYGDDSQSKNSMSNIQITVPIADSEQRSIEINERKRRHSKTPPPRLSVKERLGGKVEDVRKREARVVQSTVERVKARSKTPKTELAYRRVTVDRERGRKLDSRIESSKSDRRTTEKTTEHHRVRSSSKETKKKDTNKPLKEVKNASSNQSEKSELKNIDADREKKKTTLDEAHFEPDYDETVESDNEHKDENNKKRENSVRAPSESKKNKVEDETITLNLTNVKKKPDSDSESSSNSEYSSSSTSSAEARKRSKKKKKRSKKKRKRAASESDSDSDSSSDDHKKKKKRRKHKKKSSKKKKKSKHK